jgi:diketogulonate reductase-like aldo/keto reductase
VRFCQEKKIAVTAFSSFGVSSYVELGLGIPEESVLDDPEIREIAAAHGKTPA